jgi:methionyl-tRNA synthetase
MIWESILLSKYFLFLPLIVPLILWTLFWKGLALWTAGNRKEKVWFIILFLVNTVGILEIIYLLTRKKKKK